jgi:SAM-dependent methyltransferase
MTFKMERRFITALVVAATVFVTAAAHAADQSAGDAERLIKALDLRDGLVVAEIGAGDGELSVSIAKAVGENGRLFSNELNAGKVDALRLKVQNHGLRNITVVAGSVTDTNLPDQCCDAVFMRDVYHHFSDPVAMNTSILKALRPGGKLVIFEFGPPPGSESADVARRGEDGQHGITPATLERELKAAGFEIVSTEEYGFRSSMTVARRPLR